MNFPIFVFDFFFLLFEYINFQFFSNQVFLLDFVYFINTAIKLILDMMICLSRAH